MSKKPGSTGNYYEEAKSWYQENHESLQCSRNRYRLFSLVMSILFGLCAAAVITLLPLKQYIYRLIEVNKQTGEMTVLKEVEGNTFPATWVMDRYFINQYIQQREAYSLEDIKRSFNVVIAMSAKPVADQYMADTIDSNPASPIKVLNNSYYKEVNVLSINRLNTNTAIARYQTITHSKTNLHEAKIEDWQVVMKWEYVNRTLSYEERDKNPLGFTVTYYQTSPVFAAK